MASPSSCHHSEGRKCVGTRSNYRVTWYRTDNGRKAEEEEGPNNRVCRIPCAPVRACAVLCVTVGGRKEIRRAVALELVSSGCTGCEVGADIVSSRGPCGVFCEMGRCVVTRRGRRHAPPTPEGVTSSALTFVPSSPGTTLMVSRGFPLTPQQILGCHHTDMVVVSRYNSLVQDAGNTRSNRK